MSKDNASVLLWFRRDLRLKDNAALSAAIETGKNIIALFVWSPEEEAPWEPSGASLVWLHHSLLVLEDALRKKGNSLLIKRGKTDGIILSLAEQFKIDQVFANKIYEPDWITRDASLEALLSERGIDFSLYPGSLLFDPSQIKTGQGNPFQVFTPFWKACLLRDSSPAKPLAEPELIPAPSKLSKDLSVEELGLLPKIAWDTGIREFWRPGFLGAEEAMAEFVDDALSNYAIGRDVPSTQGTSRVSPHLHFGEITPRMIWHEVSAKMKKSPSRSRPPGSPAAEKVLSSEEIYLKEIGWREFAHHVLCNFPHSANEALRRDYNKFPWSKNEAHLHAWQKGMTGYPMVDAGMRELWHTGWMHNRVRMIVASFLVKHLLQPWQDGARWFWDTLVDADLASNTLGWQWSAGSGADAAPYFRIFNPVLQGEKFDPQGIYVRKWIPELSALPDQYIHKPWTAPPLVLQAAKVELGKTYPAPIVEHTFARKRALEALSHLKTPT
ncbi:MAG: DNA photolyase family protein [Candidatus Obscuribacterales bacterium]|nr:DNA photolyase family protein [Candidatus Obscuribacterales bacterium]